MAAVGTATSHAGQTTLHLTPMHGKVNVLKSMIANIQAALKHVKNTAEQFKTTDPWAVLMRYVSERIAPTLGPFRPTNHSGNGVTAGFRVLKASRQCLVAPQYR